MKLTSVAIYCGIGAICHAVFLSTTFDWSSAWTFAWLFAWPLLLIGRFVGFIFEFLLICLILGSVLIFSEAVRKMREVRLSKKQ